MDCVFVKYRREFILVKLSPPCNKSDGQLKLSLSRDLNAPWIRKKGRERNFTIHLEKIGQWKKKKKKRREENEMFPLIANGTRREKRE